MVKLFSHTTILLAVAFCAAACSYTNHFEDDWDETKPYTVLNNIDASDYGAWTYVNLETGKTERHPDASAWIYSGTGREREAQTEQPIDEDWHIALHRYEIKTNGASVMNTHLTDISAITTLPEGDYKGDETVTYDGELAKDGGTQYLLVMDMTNMVNEEIGYAKEGRINRVLSDGVTRTPTGGMPPTLFGTTGEVFVLKWADGTWAALQITKTYGGNDGAKSGVLSFNCKFFRQ